MIGQKRFGRKIPLPSTTEIRRDLILMTKVDAIVRTMKNEFRSSEDLAAAISGLIDENQISRSRAKMLINGYGRGKAALATVY